MRPVVFIFMKHKLTLIDIYLFFIIIIKREKEEEKKIKLF